MAVIKSFKDIVNSMLRLLHALRPNVDTSPGTFTRDVIVDAPANELASLYLDFERASNAQSPDLATVTDIEKLGKNFQIRRRGPTKATGVVTFYSFEIPATSITISRGTALVSKAIPPEDTAQQYVTTQEVVLHATDFRACPSGRYEVDAPIRAVTSGIAANVPPGVITAMLTPIPGIAGVYNYYGITNGTDYEPLTLFRKRLKSVLTGNSLGTVDGYYQTITRNLEVIDACVASADTGIAELRRDDPGAVDIYIRGGISAQAPSETYTVPIAGSPEFAVSSQPLDLLAVGSFELVGSVTGALVEGTHYTVVIDNSKYGGSIRGADKFVFASNAIYPGESIEITYSYNSLITMLQTYMDKGSRKVLGTDLLIKQAKPRQILVDCTISVLPGHTPTNVVNAVINALSIFFNSYSIGEEVQQSDVLATIANTKGVDDVTVPLTTFKENDTVGDPATQDSAGNLVLPADSYAVIGNVSVSIRE